MRTALFSIFLAGSFLVLLASGSIIKLTVEEEIINFEEIPSHRIFSNEEPSKEIFLDEEFIENSDESDILESDKNLDDFRSEESNENLNDSDDSDDDGLLKNLYQSDLVQVSRSGNNKLETVKGTVRSNNLDKGKKPSGSVKKAMRMIGKKGDEAGHLIARVLGGSGKDVQNFIPINSSTNKQMYHKAEALVYKALKKDATLYADITITLDYDPNGTYKKRPTKIHFSGDIKNAAGKTQKKVVNSWSNP